MCVLLAYSHVYNFMERDLIKVKDVPVLNFESISLKVKSSISVASNFMKMKIFGVKLDISKV